MKTIKLRILNKMEHNRIVDEFDFDIKAESNLYVTFECITDIQHGELEHAIEKEVYRLCGDDDYEFNDISTTNKHNYKDFEDYYEQHKTEYMGSESSDKREHKRIHDGLHDLIHFISKKFDGNNATATTTLLLQFGAYEFYKHVSLDEFEQINTAYFNAATSAFDHKNYFNGNVSKIMLSRPAQAYTNSRAVILDVNRRDKQITFYQTDFVFKTLENIHRIGFDGTYARYGYELLISLAMSNCKLIQDIGICSRMEKLAIPTIEEIQFLVKSDFIINGGKIQ